MRFPACCTASARHRRGFNLVEAAIVLGVIGLVIGGIWIAASQVRISMATEQTYNGIMQAGSLLQEVVTQEVIASGNGYMRDGTLARTISTKVAGFEGSYLEGSITCVTTPIGATSYMCLEQFGNPSFWPNFVPIRLRLTNVPKAYCIRLAMKFRSAIMADPNGNYFAGITAGPVSGGTNVMMPAVYNGNSFTVPRFDNIDTMCSADLSVFQIHFVPHML